MKKLIYLLCFFSLNFISCTDTQDDMEDSGLVVPNEEHNIPDKDILKKNFSKALVKVLDNSPIAREVIKKEALKKIDHDYDVIYLMIKDIPLENEVTLKAALSNYIGLDTLDLIEQFIPTLTIFVPTLPKEIFSAEIWDATQDSPAVSYRPTDFTGIIPTYFSIPSGIEEFILERGEIPRFPVIVVKESERIMISNQNNRTTKTNGSNRSTSSTMISDFNLKFASQVFDNQNSSNNSILTKGSRSESYNNLTSIDLKQKYKYLFDAYDEFGLDDGWQRDFIYYNLTKKETKGKFKSRFMEHLMGFELLPDSKGSGWGIYDKIVDQSEDPKVNEYKRPGSASSGRNPIASDWTNGELEFAITIYVGSKTAVGSTYKTSFRVDPSLLFNPEYTEYDKKKGLNRLTGLKLLRYYFPTPLPLFDWNLENYSHIIKISIEEFDISEAITTTTTQSSEFATNFGIEQTSGESVKVGLKFGASKKETLTNTYTVVRNVGSDFLGEVIINFSDPVIISKDSGTPKREGTGRGSITKFNPYYNTKYHTDSYRIFIAPIDAYGELD